MNPNVAQSTMRKLAALLVLAALAGAVVLSACQRGPSSSTPQVFETQWHDLLKQRDYAGAQKLIDQREKQLPGDAEVSIARANLYFRRATGQAKGFTTGGGAADSATIDTLLVRRALDVLADGIRKHPERFDMRLGLAYLFQQVGLRVPEVELVRQTISFAKEYPDSLRWNYGAPLPRPAEDYVPQMLHDYVRYYIDRGAPGDDQAVFALAQPIMQAYPHSTYVPNDVAFMYASRNQWEQSLEFLRAAERADSTDALVLFNLGWANEKLKRRDPALHYYRRAIATSRAGGNSDIDQSSRQRLVALGERP